MHADLAALVVHDLKNALGALEAELGVLAQQPDRARALQSHRHCSALRERFVMYLALYGADGEMRAHPTDESPADLLQALAGPVAGDPPALSMQVALQPSAPPFWFFDRRLVRLALEAALHNAKRFARRQVALGARCEEGCLVLHVDDDGPGLGAALPSNASTGLGTALCKAVARAHANAGRTGRVTLGPRPGGGARFELWLP
ncbi:HAMP domain-containing sensor histidine kinase [Aquincola sp. MAHUQ-54]|uniref:histidine kinase n=1 Tax=Aquincola agrisoli TaxID=3119538 RepID=A0AAW9QKD0_9BURK